MRENKRRIVAENKSYSEEWEEQDFFIIQNTKLIHLIYREIVFVMRDLTLKSIIKQNKVIIWNLIKKKSETIKAL